MRGPVEALLLLARPLREVQGEVAYGSSRSGRTATVSTWGRVWSCFLPSGEDSQDPGARGGSLPPSRSRLLPRRKRAAPVFRRTRGRSRRPAESRRACGGPSSRAHGRRRAPGRRAGTRRDCGRCSPARLAGVPNRSDAAQRPACVESTAWPLRVHSLSWRSCCWSRDLRKGNLDSARSPPGMRGGCIRRRERSGSTGTAR